VTTRPPRIRAATARPSRASERTGARKPPPLSARGAVSPRAAQTHGTSAPADNPLTCQQPLEQNATAPGVFPDPSWLLRAGLPAPQGYQTGIELMRQGAASDVVYFIAQGLVKLNHLHAAGQASIVGLRSAGWIVGAAAVIQARPYAATATTVTKCLLHRIAADRFRGLVRRRAKLSWYVHEMHSQEVYGQLAQVAGLGALSARQRLERLLADLVPALTRSCPRKGLRLELPLRMWEVAQLISVTPPYLSQLLAELECDGLIRRERGWLYLLSLDRLERA